jgi:hypothetical protein
VCLAVSDNFSFGGHPVPLLGGCCCCCCFPCITNLSCYVLNTWHVCYCFCL